MRGRLASTILHKYFQHQVTQILTILFHTNTINTILNKYYQTYFTKIQSIIFHTHAINIISNEYYQYFFTQILSILTILFKANPTNIISHKNKYYQYYFTQIRFSLFPIAGLQKNYPYYFPLTSQWSLLSLVWVKVRLDFFSPKIHSF